MKEKRRRKRRGRGSTVQQLFTEVLSSYFTRKHGHSYRNSPTGQSPTLSAWHSCTCLLHFLPFILSLWLEGPPGALSLSPPSTDLYLKENKNWIPVLKKKIILQKAKSLIQWSFWTKWMQTTKDFNWSNFPIFLSVLHGIIMIYVNIHI